jgi:hypothetical protein
MGKKVRHWVDTDKIYSVSITERRKKTYVIFSAKVDGKRKNDIELTEEDYGKMLADGYYDEKEK